MYCSSRDRVWEMKGFEPQSTEWEFRLPANYYTIYFKKYNYSEDITAVFRELLGIKNLKITSNMKIN